MRCLISLAHGLGLSQVCIVDEPFPCNAIGGDARRAANGLASEGNGHLYIAAAHSLDEYFIVSDTVQLPGSDPGNQ